MAGVKAADKLQGSGLSWVRVIFRRRLLVIILLTLQALFFGAIIGSSSLQYSSVSRALIPISFAVCLYILNKKEKPAYKLTWIMLILIVPIFGGIFYIVFTIQSSSRKLRRQTHKTDAALRPLFLLPGDSLPRILEEYRDCAPQVRYLQEFAGFPVYRRTRTAYFPSGEAFFERLLPELEKAKKYIFLEFFIL
ncbi:MAG: PLDc N-terminal domain-containing protein, partial [Spirochaetaceae bacterium]|nr:PLDc N-terminal domain-containing protein [Spirochaetaceae bacterium]